MMRLSRVAPASPALLAAPALAATDPDAPTYENAGVGGRGAFRPAGAPALRALLPEIEPLIGARLIAMFFLHKATAIRPVR
jgi:hypothetical protein